MPLLSLCRWAIAAPLASLLAVSSFTIQTTSAQDLDFLLPGGEFQGKTIKSVVIKYLSEKTVSESALRAHMATAVGKKYNQSMFDEDTRALYNSGLVDDVSFLADHQDGGVKIIVQVTTRPLINGVGFTGNEQFSQTRLAKISGLEAGQTLSDQKILGARQKLEEHYQGFGYPDIQVTHRLQETARPGYADLVFIIGEGGKNEVRKIRFQGNSNVSTAELRREMNTKQKGWLSFFTKSGRIDNIRLDDDLRLLENYYRSRGYMKAKIGTPQRTPVKDGRVDLVIPVDEGLKYTVNQVGFGKMTVFTPEQLDPALSLVAGMPYSSKKVADDIRAIRSYYGSRGYADATVKPDIREVSSDRINIFYRITEGRRYRVGRVNVQGNVISQDKVLRREIPMKPGEYFNSVDMEITRKRLENLRYFEPRNGVQVASTPSSQSGYRDVNVLVQEKKTGSVNFGLGFSSIDSVVGFINLEQTNFDLFNWGKFTGAGQRFSLSLRGGTERRDFRLSLVEPWFLGRKLSLGTDLYYRDLIFLSDQYDQTQIGGSVFLRKPLGRKSYIRAEYKLEQIDIEIEDDTPATSAFQDFAGDFLHSALTLSYVYDSRDSNKLPRKGHKIDAGVTFAGGPLGGDVDNYTFTLSGQKHWNFKWDTILTLRGRASVVDGYSDSDNVPIFNRQFLGGARDLRGFEFRDIGPRDADTGEVFGGATSAYMTVEYTFPILETVRGAVFYDVGFVNEDAWDFSTSRLASDVGIGARLDLPIGPLAIDYAIPLSTPDQSSDNGGQFQFYINSQF